MSEEDKVEFYRSNINLHSTKSWILFIKDRFSKCDKVFADSLIQDQARYIWRYLEQCDYKYDSLMEFQQFEQPGQGKSMFLGCCHLVIFTNNFYFFILLENSLYLPMFSGLDISEVDRQEAFDMWANASCDAVNNFRFDFYDNNFQDDNMNFQYDEFQRVIFEGKILFLFEFITHKYIKLCKFYYLFLQTSLTIVPIITDITKSK